MPEKCSQYRIVHDVELCAVYFDGNKVKGRISKRVLQENKASQIFRKTNTYPPGTHTCFCVSGGKKCSFLGKFGVLYFLVTPVYRFAFLPHYRRFVPLICRSVHKTLPNIYGRFFGRHYICLTDYLKNS